MCSELRIWAIRGGPRQSIQNVENPARHILKQEPT